MASLIDLTAVGRHRSLVLGVLLTVVLTLTSCTNSSAHVSTTRGEVEAVSSTAERTRGGEMTFSAEFDGPAGSGPNAGLATPVWHNDGCSTHGCMGTIASFRPDNARQDGHGNLVLTARADAGGQDRCGRAGRCRFTSARLSMLDWANGGAPSWKQRGGHIEARIRVDAGAGVWPAFWTVGADQARLGWPRSGEIDIFEARGQHPAAIAQVAHGPGGRQKTMAGGTTVLDGEISGWHTYAVDWDPDPVAGYIVWTIDGVERQRATASEAGRLWTGLTIPHSLILSMAVGGWAGEPEQSRLPAEMFIDYIRVDRHPIR